jgi:hypothetical protein
MVRAYIGDTPATPQDLQIENVRYRDGIVKLDGALLLDIINNNLDEVRFIFKIPVTRVAPSNTQPLTETIRNLRSSLQRSHSPRNILSSGIAAGMSLATALGSGSIAGAAYLSRAMEGAALGQGWSNDIPDATIAEHLFSSTIPPSAIPEFITIDLRVRSP